MSTFTPRLYNPLAPIVYAGAIGVVAKPLKKRVRFGSAMCYSSISGGTDSGVRIMSLLDEAQKCRSDAEALTGRPEAPFLLKIARAFEELAELNRHMPEAPKDMMLAKDTEGAGVPHFFGKDIRN